MDATQAPAAPDDQQVVLQLIALLREPTDTAMRDALMRLEAMRPGSIAGIRRAVSRLTLARSFENRSLN
ncbi:hypothetical protein JIP62_06405 [Brevundimonas vitis]|uniref:Uncharacterized protein n=1 Tax=Brevundimonas vitisensis TaxID=2800818 RepID=A0ABX7BR56_9CAUL|nr:hypothetical protein [Brevundimonas vitisensis]QQQ19716.1 hypothetical protein JIP62_06405 [Brevundimonas vitisensis]